MSAYIQASGPPNLSAGPSTLSSQAASPEGSYSTSTRPSGPGRLSSSRQAIAGQRGDTPAATASRVAAATSGGMADGGIAASARASAVGRAVGAAGSRGNIEGGISGLTRTTAGPLAEARPRSAGAARSAPVPAAADPGPPGNEHTMFGSPTGAVLVSAELPSGGPLSAGPPIWSVPGPAAASAAATASAASATPAMAAAADEDSEGAVERALRSLSLGGGAADLVALLTAGGEEGIGPVPGTGSGAGGCGPAPLGRELTAAAAVPMPSAGAWRASRGETAMQPEVGLRRVHGVVW